MKSLQVRHAVASTDRPTDRPTDPSLIVSSRNSLARFKRGVRSASVVAFVTMLVMIAPSGETLGQTISNVSATASGPTNAQVYCEFPVSNPSYAEVLWNTQGPWVTGNEQTAFYGTPGATLNTTIGSLSPSQTYYLKIRAECWWDDENGGSWVYPESDWQQFTTPAAISITGGVTVELQTGNPSQANVSWDVSPANPTGNTHIVYWTGAGLADTWSTTASEDATGHVTATISGLGPSRDYYVWVVSTEPGNGSASTANNPITRTTPPAISISEVSWSFSGDPVTAEIRVRATMPFGGSWDSASVSANNVYWGSGTPDANGYVTIGNIGVMSGTTYDLHIEASGTLNGNTVTCSDDSYSLMAPGPGVLSFSSYPSSAMEGETVTLSVQRLGGALDEVTVDWTAGGTASIDGTASGTLIFTNGVTEQTFQVLLLDDEVVTGGTTLEVALSNPTGGAGIGTWSPPGGGYPGPCYTNVSISVQDNDSAGVFQFQTNCVALAVAEGDTATFTVERTGGSVGTATVNCVLSGGTATAGTNFTLWSSLLTFAHGETSKQLTIETLHDWAIGGDTTVELALSDATGGATVGAPSSATLTIQETDACGTVRFAATEYSVQAGCNVAIIHVARADGCAGDVSVNYSTSDGTATNGVHYSAASGNLTFAPGDSDKTFEVPLLSAGQPGSSQTVNLTLSGLDGSGTLGEPSSATLVIVNPPAIDSISINQQESWEGGHLHNLVTITWHISSAGPLTNGQHYVWAIEDNVNPVAIGVPSPDGWVTAGPVSLDPGEERHVWLQSLINGLQVTHNNGGNYHTITGPPIVPVPSPTLRIENLTATTADLVWSVADFPRSVTHGVTVTDVSTNGVVLETTLSSEGANNQFRLLLEGLIRGHSYHCAVSSMPDSTDGLLDTTMLPIIRSIVFTAPAWVRLPDPPTVVTQTYNNIVLSLPLENDSGQTIHHVVTYRWTDDTGAQEETFMQDSLGDATEVNLSFENLLGGTTYSFTIQSYVDGHEPGELGYSATYTGSFTTPQVPLRIVGSPTVASIACDSAAITWTLENDTGLPAINTVWCWAASGGDALELSTNSPPGTNVVSIILTDLQPATIYYYFVRSRNEQADACGPDDEFTTLPIIRIISGPQVVGRTGDSVTVRWQVANDSGQSVSHHVRVFNESGNEVPVSELVQTAEGGWITVTATGLQPSTNYRFAVRSAINNQPGYFAEVGTDATPPFQTTLAISGVNTATWPDGQNPELTWARVTWQVTPANQANGTHEVRKVTDGSPLAVGVDDGSGQIVADLPFPLNRGEAWPIYVESRDLNNIPATDGNYYRIEGLPLVTISNLTVATNSTNAVVTWNVDGHGADVLTNLVTYWTGDNPASAVTAELVDGVATATLTNLLPGTHYIFVVFSDTGRDRLTTAGAFAAMDGSFETIPLLMITNSGTFTFGSGTNVAKIFLNLPTGIVQQSGGEHDVGVATNFGSWTISGGVANLTNYVGEHQGTLTVSGGTLHGTLTIGNTGSLNRLTVTNGGVMAGGGSGVIGNRALSSNNIAIVTGAGSLWSNSGNLFLGYDGSSNQLTINDGGAVFNRDGVVGYTPSACNNAVMVSGAGSVWSNSRHLYVGYGDTGNQLTINDSGAVFNKDGYVGCYYTGNSNAVLVSGLGSLWSNSGSLYVGCSGAGNQLAITNGGTVAATNIVLGADSSSTGNLLAVSDGYLYATNATRTGTLDIRRGALTLDSGSVTVNRLFATNGADSVVNFYGGTLQSGGSSISNGVPFLVGNGTDAATLNLMGGTHSFADGLIVTNNAQLTGTGAITGVITNAGTIAPGNSVGILTGSSNLILVANSQLQMELAGTDDWLYDQINLAGTLNFGGTLTLSLLGGFNPHVGDRFDLFDFSSSSGFFDSSNLPILDDPLWQWDLSALYSTGEIKVEMNSSPLVTISNLLVTPLTSTNVVISWNAYSHGSNLSTHTVSYWTTDFITNTVAATFDTINLQATAMLTNLLPASAYDFFVFSDTGLDTSNTVGAFAVLWSNFFTPLPLRISDVTGVATAPDRAEISWHVENDIGLPATNTVFYWPTGDAGLMQSSNTPATFANGTVIILLKELLPGTEYSFSVATEAAGWLSTSDGIPFPTLPPYISITSPPTRGDVILADKSTTLNWTIDNISGATVHHTVSYIWVNQTGFSGTGDATVDTPSDVSNVSVPINNLRAGATYNFTVQSTVEGHVGEPWYVATVGGAFTTTDMPAEQIISIANVASSSIGTETEPVVAVTWQVSKLEPYTFATAYHFVVATPDGLPFNLKDAIVTMGVEDDEGEVTALVAGLNPAETYHYYVFSMIDAEPGHYAADDNDGDFYPFPALSGTSSGGNPEPVIIVPPSALVTKTTALISWEVLAPSVVPITHLVVYNTNSPPTPTASLIAWDPRDDVTNGTASVLITGLSPGMTGHYFVQSVIDLGSGNYATMPPGDDFCTFVTLPAGVPLGIVTYPSGSHLLDGVVGGAYSRTLSVSGGTGPYTWTIIGGALPTGLTLNETGTIAGTPTVAGLFPFSVQVTDSTGANAQQSLLIEIRPPGVTGTPLNIETQSPLPLGRVGSSYHATLVATGGSLPYQWSLASGPLPAGVTISASGILSGEPAPTAAGQFDFTARVTDSVNTSVEKAFTLWVVAPPGGGNSAVKITTSTLPNGRIGEDYGPQGQGVEVSATGGNLPYTWTTVVRENTGDRVPSGLDIDSVTGLISGSPTEDGTFTFGVQVTDDTWMTDPRNPNSDPIQDFDVAFFQVRILGEIQILSSGGGEAEVNRQYSGVLRASGGQPPYTWTVTGLSPFTQDGAFISGTPGPAHLGQLITFCVHVSDTSGLQATGGGQIWVVEQKLLSFTGGTLEAVQGQPYLGSVSASGGTPPYSYSITGGNWPPGLTWNSDGTINGTPTTIGQYIFSVRVTDSVSTASGPTAAFEMTIAEAPPDDPGNYNPPSQVPPDQPSPPNSIVPETPPSATLKNPNGPAGRPCPRSGRNEFNPTTGNAFREILDLEVWGGVGEHKLAWKRYHNTRVTDGLQLFGTAGNWRHSYQWEIVDAGLNEFNQPLLDVYHPDGVINRFTKVNATEWQPEKSISDRLFRVGNRFTLRTADRWIYTFEKSTTGGQTRYQLLRFLDSQSNRYDLFYDGQGRLERVVEPAGRELQISYTAFDAIQQVSAPGGRNVTYTYTASGAYQELTRATYSDEKHADYVYDQVVSGVRPLLVQATDPRKIGIGSRISYVYFTGGAAPGTIKEEHNLVNGISGDLIARLGSFGNYEPAVVYANGGVQTYQLDQTHDDRVAAMIDSYGKTTCFFYDENGYLERRTDPAGNATSWIRNAYGNPLVQNHADGGTEFWFRDAEDRVLSHLDPMGNTTSFEYDISGHLLLVSYPDGTSEEFAYNGFSQVVAHKLRNGGTESFEYDNRGLLTKATDPLGNETHYGYDNADRVASVADARGKTTAFEYDDRGLVKKITFPDDQGRTITRQFQYDDFGHKTSETNERNKTWTYHYDDFDRLDRVTEPQTDTVPHVTYYTYGTIGKGSGCAGGSCAGGDQPTSIMLPSGKKTQIEYDLEGRKKSVTVGQGSADAATTNYYYDDAGNLLAVRDPRGAVSWFEYDAVGRRLSAWEPTGRKTFWTYDLAGNKLTERRPNGTETYFYYDNMNRLTDTTDPAGTTHAEYDGGDNQVVLQDARGSTYHFIHDFLNRKIAALYPDHSQESYSYDAVGNLTGYTTRAGQVKTITYDSRNRETGYTWSDGTPGATMTYDEAGRLTSVVSPQSSLGYTYNDANEMLSETQTIAGQAARTVGYTYDSDGNRRTMTYPDGTVITYDYTGRNQLATVSSGQGTVVSYQYDAAGNRTGKTLANGQNVAYGHDAAGRVKSIVTPQSALAYGYDPVGNRTNVNRNGTVENYSYDATDQLTGVTYGVSRSAAYNYDAVGNRTSVSYNGVSTPYANANSLNQYPTVGGVSLSYDLNGNLTGYGGSTYSYDAQNRMVSVSSGVQMSYDARNRCVSRTIGGVTTYLYYDGWNLIEERDAAGQLFAKYIHGATVDELLTLTTQPSTLNQTYYYAHDALGSVTHLTAANGAIVERYTYDVFGQPTVLALGTPASTISFYGNRFMFTGREWLAELGLYDYRNRMYSPGLGRFMQTDPIGFGAGDVNIYRYVANNPANLLDAFGLDSVGVYYNGRWNTSWDRFIMGPLFFMDALNRDHTVGASSLEDLANKLKHMRDQGISIDTLTFYDHGNVGTQFFGEDQLSDNLRTWSSIAGLVKENGTIHLKGCYVAQGRREMMRLANKGRRRVTAHTGDYYPLFGYNSGEQWTALPTDHQEEDGQCEINPKTRKKGSKP